MHIKIRDWELHFERDRSKQWKHLSWVPIPNKQGSGYKIIMAQKNGAEIYGCWIAIVGQASLCTPRGDLSKYDLKTLTLLTMIQSENILKNAIEFLSQTLDWIIIMENLDKNVNINLDKNVHILPNGNGSSILSYPVLSNPVLSFSVPDSVKGKIYESAFKAFLESRRRLLPLKGKQPDTIEIIEQGILPRLISLGGKDDEKRKRILEAAITAQSISLFDPDKENYGKSNGANFKNDGKNNGNNSGTPENCARKGEFPENLTLPG